MIKLSISNIAWKNNDDEKMYQCLRSNGFSGLEIAPSRLFGDIPYDNIQKARDFSNYLHTKYHLSISSIQSIWYGLKEELFTTVRERDFLLKYTKKAIKFANTSIVIDCIVP